MSTDNEYAMTGKERAAFRAGKAIGAATLTDDVRALLQAVIDALDVPLADRAEDDQARASLLSRRASEVRAIITSVLRDPHPTDATARLLRWVAEHPIPYRSWQDRQGDDPDAQIPLLPDGYWDGPHDCSLTKHLECSRSERLPHNHKPAPTPFTGCEDCGTPELCAPADRCPGRTTPLKPTLPAELRCDAAHHDDPTPCVGPVVVTVLDSGNAGADGCEHHAARLLASLNGGRVYGLPDAPDGAAISVFKAADTTRPFAWYEGAPRTGPSMRSHAENRQDGGE